MTNKLCDHIAISGITEYQLMRLKFEMRAFFSPADLAELEIAIRYLAYCRNLESDEYEFNSLSPTEYMEASTDEPWLKHAHQCACCKRWFLDEYQDGVTYACDGVPPNGCGGQVRCYGCDCEHEVN